MVATLGLTGYNQPAEDSDGTCILATHLHSTPRRLRIAILSIACGVMASIVQAATYKGLVVGITDGDTIKVLDSSQRQHEVRLAGIDAPEKSQAFGRRSKQSLSDLVFQKQVTIDTSKNDRYGREIGKVLLDGQDVNLEQVRRGLAWHYKAYEREQTSQDRASYAREEVSAREARRGLWSDPHAVAPWDFRRNHSAKR